MVNTTKSATMNPSEVTNQREKTGCLARAGGGAEACGSGSAVDRLNRILDGGYSFGRGSPNFDDGCGGWYLVMQNYHTIEAIPPFRSGRNPGAPVVHVPQSLSQKRNVHREIRFLNEAIRPDRLHQAFAGQKPAMIGNQREKKIESFWRKRNCLVAPHQQVLGRIQLERTETVMGDGQHGGFFGSP